MSAKQTAIITGAAGGIGTGLVQGFLEKVITSSQPLVTPIEN